jgi:hypothetical protein
MSYAYTSLGADIPAAPLIQVQFRQFGYVVVPAKILVASF